MRVAINNCKSLKQNYPCPAAEMYSQSHQFRGQQKYFEKGYDDWYIVSSKYGIIHHTDVIEPYDMIIGVSGNNMKNRDKIESWDKDVIAKVNQQLLDMVDRGLKIDYHTSNKYYKPLSAEVRSKINHIKQPAFPAHAIGNRYTEYTELLDTKSLDEVNKMIGEGSKKVAETPLTYYHPIHGEFFGTSAQLARIYKINNGGAYKLYCDWRGTKMCGGWVKDKTLLDKLYQLDSKQWRFKK